MEQQYRHTLGILGLGDASTRFYIKEINKGIHDSFGDFHTAGFVLLNTNFNNYNPYLPSQTEYLLAQLQKDISTFEAISVEYLMIPNITLHETIDQLNTSLKIIHPIRLALKTLQSNNMRQLTIFGSSYTMTSQYLKRIFTTQGIMLKSPSQKDQKQIDAFRKNVYHQIETTTDISRFQKLQANYLEHGPILIACTELSLYSLQTNAGLYDMAFLQIGKGIELLKKAYNL